MKWNPCSGGKPVQTELKKQMGRSTNSGSRAATSPRTRTSQTARRENRQGVHLHFPLREAPFLGINRETGGLILLTCEKLRSFSANETRARESTKRSGSPTGTSMKVLT